MTAHRSVSFVEFCARIGVRLTPGQRVLAAVAFDGADPATLPPPERAIAARLFGDMDVIPSSAHGVLTIVAGARSGKSFLGALRILHLALTVPLDTLAPGEQAAGLIIAPDLRLARQVLGYARGAVRGVRDLAQLVEADTSDRIVLRRGRQRVVLECVPASRGGAAGRGRSLVGAVLDESAYFRDENFSINDRDVFAAVTPRVLPGGQVLIASTPWAEAGLLYEEWKRNFGRPVTSLVVHAPTLELRDDERTRQTVARERERDPENARQEFDAEFLGAGAGAVFDAAMVERCVVRDRPVTLAPDPTRTAVAGFDAGFSSDSSALVILRVAPEGRLEVADVLELRPRAGQPLLPGDVLRGHVLPRLQAHGARTLVIDQHYAQSVREHLGNANVRILLAPPGADGKAEMYRAAQAAIHGERLDLPPFPRLTRQLREVTTRPLPGGGHKIDSPRWRSGGHGDLASALVAAVWAARGARSGSASTWVGVGRRRESLTVLGIRDESPTFSVGSDGRVRCGGVRGGGGWSSGGY